MRLRSIGSIGVLLLSSLMAGCAFDPGLLFPINDQVWTDRPSRERGTSYRYTHRHHHHPHHVARGHTPDRRGHHGRRHWRH